MRFDADREWRLGNNLKGGGHDLYQVTTAEFAFGNITENPDALEGSR
jgi:hypothetical protein